MRRLTATRGSFKVISRKRRRADRVGENKKSKHSGTGNKCRYDQEYPVSESALGLHDALLGSFEVKGFVVVVAINRRVRRLLKRHCKGEARVQVKILMDKVTVRVAIGEYW